MSDETEKTNLYTDANGANPYGGPGSLGNRKLSASALVDSMGAPQVGRREPKDQPDPAATRRALVRGVIACAVVIAIVVIVVAILVGTLDFEI